MAEAKTPPWSIAANLPIPAIEEFERQMAERKNQNENKKNRIRYIFTSTSDEEEDSDVDSTNNEFVLKYTKHSINNLNNAEVDSSDAYNADHQDTINELNHSFDFLETETQSMESEPR